MVNQQSVESNDVRLDKARKLVASGRVRRNTDTIWCVGSGTLNSPTLFWKVEHFPQKNQITCECPDFTISGNTCKHILAVALFTADKNTEDISAVEVRETEEEEVMSN